MKNHKIITKKLYSDYLQGSIENVINTLLEESKGLIDPQINKIYGFYDEPDEFEIIGWLPLTEEEIKAAKEKAKKEKEARLLKKNKEQEEKRIRDLEKLAELLSEYPEEIVNYL